jgi:hypothetical protein
MENGAIVILMRMELLIFLLSNGINQKMDILHIL